MNYPPYPFSSSQQASCLAGAGAALAFVLLFGPPVTIQAQPRSPEPVEEFRQALLADRKIPTRPINAEEVALRKKVLDYRRRILEEQAKKLTTLREISRVLILQEWRTDDTDRELAEIDRDVHRELSNRFAKSVQEIAAGDNKTSQAATAELAGELAVLVPVPPSGTQGILVRRLLTEQVVPELLKLTRSSDPLVRGAAALALGKIQANNADVRTPMVSSDINAALAELLQTKDVQTRRAAAKALETIIPVVSLERRQAVSAIFTAADLLRLLEGTAPLAVRSLQDEDRVVRRFASDALQRMTRLLSERDLIRLELDRYPARGRTDLTDGEKALLDADLKRFKEEREQYWQRLRLLMDQLPVLRKAVNDADLAVRLHTLEMLENLALFQKRLRRQEAQILRVEVEKVKPHANDPLLAIIGGLRNELIEDLKDPDVRIRLSTLNALEPLGAEARPAATLLIERLEDNNLFVRWASARLLGKIGTPPPKGAVAALIGRLNDPDLAVRIGAASALGHYGPEASEAVPALARVVNQGDAEFRMAVMHALAALGKDAGQAVPAIVRELSHPDARVRRAAADMLGLLGKDAASATAALTQALEDEDPDVRRFASEALLKIAAR